LESGGRFGHAFAGISAHPTTRVLATRGLQSFRC
jgi:hypothetical protein